MKKYDFDYIVIGGGPAGIAAALNLAKKTKKRIALVKGENALGGSFISRDVPYLFNLNFAHQVSTLQNRPEFGQQTLHYNLPTLIAHQAEVVEELVNKRQQSLKDAGVTVLDHSAYFIDSHTIAIGNRKYTSDIFILATGSGLKTGKIFGLDTADYLTPDSVITLRRLPKYALVVGGGATGCEIASYLTALGSKVILMEREDHLLPKEDPEIGTALAEYFAKKLGIAVITNSEVVALEQNGNDRRVVFSTNHQEKTARIDCVVLATGSTPNLDYGLENAGVKYKSSGIITNRFFQTSAKNIYAIGDCLGDEISSTERVEYQASILAANFSGKSKTLAKYSGFVRRVNAYPEIAIVGKTEAKLKKAKLKYNTSIIRLKDLPASKIFEENYGFIKVIANRTGRVLGGSIMAPHADLIATELSLAVRGHLNILDLASAPHLGDSYNIAIKLAAKNLIKQ